MELKQRLRSLWRDTTIAEQTLWQALKNPGQHHRLRHYQFSRHVAIGDFFIDFICSEMKLAIELDSGNCQKQSAECSTVLQYKGYLVIKLLQHEILTNLNEVLEHLTLVLTTRKVVLQKQLSQRKLSARK